LFKFTKENLENHRNQGGFDLLGTGRDKIKTNENFEDCLKTINSLQLTGVVIIGGDDSNTNAVQLAEFLLTKQSTCCIIGIPKTIDGDLKGNGIEVSFGHHTATRVYAELVGNLMTDNLSTKKYYSFVRLMGRDASHITLEVALKTHPNYCFISEEIGNKKQSIQELTQALVNIILKRAELGKNYGIFLIPEGVPGFIPELNDLILDLNTKSPNQLEGKSKEVYNFLPHEIQEELLAKRDDHGNVQLSLIETERLFAELVTKELKKVKEYKMDFASLKHFYGYEGRCGFPTNFDSDYCWTLGFTAGLLLTNKKTGYMACVRNLSKDVSNWEVFGLPIASLTWSENRLGKLTTVIKKSLVDLNGKPFENLKKEMKNWELEDQYSNPGPIQFHGKTSESRTLTLLLEN